MTDSKIDEKHRLDAFKRLDFALSNGDLMQDGSADECHRFYCPYNIDAVASEDDDHVDVDGYSGKPDGFDSECPRFFSIDRKKGEWTCLNGLDIIAMILKIDVIDLYIELLPHFKDEDAFPVILGYNPVWSNTFEKIEKRMGEKNKK